MHMKLSTEDRQQHHAQQSAHAQRRQSGGAGINGIQQSSHQLND
jgi:hypothetical protein